MKLVCLLTVLAFAPQILLAQDAAPQPDSPAPPTAPTPPPATGSITGHVYLGDSRLPARMAYVTLLPVTVAEAGERKPPINSAIVQTGLDGAFLMSNILPGSYYVVGLKLGYAPPVPGWYIDPDKYESASKDVKDALAALTPVLVAANRTSTTEIVLNKGAVISGSVRFDDGEPFSQTTVSLLRKDKSGKWTDFGNQESSNGERTDTDDQGNFRLSGLPAGEYLLRTTLELQGSLVRMGDDVSGDLPYRWDVYYGNGIRPSDAKIIALKDGEQANGIDLEIPLSRLHPISGTVLSQETGRPINHADVELHNADDDSIDTRTEIDPDTGQFRFPYVAEGSYTLKITGAADTVPTKDGDKPIRTYADASQPLIVKGEATGLTIQLKPLPAAAAASPATAGAP